MESGRTEDPDHLPVSTAANLRSPLSEASDILTDAPSSSVMDTMMSNGVDRDGVPDDADDEDDDHEDDDMVSEAGEIDGDESLDDSHMSLLEVQPSGLGTSLPSSLSTVSDLSDISSLASANGSSEATTPLNTVPSTLLNSGPAAPTIPQSSFPANLERLDFAVAPKSSIPTDIPSYQYASDCILAAESCRLNAYALHPEEYHLLRHHISHNQVTTYLNIRNSICRLWMLQPRKCVTRKAAVGCANARWFDAASVCYDWLVRRGHINYGCVDHSQLRAERRHVSPAAKKRKTIVVIGAGISGLSSARQLENLGEHYSEHFRMKGEEPPKIVVLEGRGRVGGRVYSREFKTKANAQSEDFQGKRHTAEMGGMIITGFDRGNPMNVLVRAQLGMTCHALTPDTTIYDSNGKAVDQERDQLVEQLYNDCLDRVSEFKLKTKPQKLIEGNYTLLEEGRDSHGDGTRTIMEAEEATAALPDAPTVSEQNTTARVDMVSVSSDKLTGRVHAEPGVPGTVEATEKAQLMGWTIADESVSLELGEAASSPDATLGSVLDSAISQYKKLVGLTALDHRLINWHIANLEYSNATNLHNLSIGLWDIDAGNEWEGSHTMVVGGYQSVARGLATCPTSLDIRARHPVKKITYHADSHAGPASIECEDGLVVEADAVVCTIPLGVLKTTQVEFSPQLPNWKTDAIDRLGFGVLNKVVLVYEEIFWDSDRHIFGVLRDAPARHSTTQADYGLNRGRFFQWFNVSNTTGLPCLIALMAGDAGFDTESTSNDVLVNEATQVLRDVFGRDIPHPVEAIVTRWGSDRFARGSYSSAAPGMLADDYDTMARSVGNLYFAGEHTIGTHPATVHGAYLSGLRAASAVVESILGPIEVPTPLVLPKDSMLLRKRKAPIKDPRQARLEAYEWEIWNHIISQVGERPAPPAKPAANAYVLFSKFYLDEAKKRCEEARKSGKGRPVPNEVRVMTSKMWKDAEPEKRQPFEDQVREQKRIYAEGLEQWNADAATWDKNAGALRVAYERDHPSAPGADEIEQEGSSASKYRRGRFVSYAEDRDSDKDLEL